MTSKEIVKQYLNFAEGFSRLQLSILAAWPTAEITIRFVHETECEPGYARRFIVDEYFVFKTFIIDVRLDSESVWREAIKVNTLEPCFVNPHYWEDMFNRLLETIKRNRVETSTFFR